MASEVAGSPFAIFADNLSRLPSERAATAIATLEEFTLWRAVWDATRAAAEEVRSRMDNSSRLKRTRESVSSRTQPWAARARRQREQLGARIGENESAVRGQAWLKRRYDQTARAREIVRDKSSTAWQAERIEERIAARLEVLLQRDDAELRREVVRALSIATDVTAPATSERPGDEWYRRLFTTIAQEYKIDAAALTDKQLVDSVLEKVWDDAIKRTRKTLKSLDADQLKGVAESVLDLLEAEELTPAQRREVTDAFGVDELTSETVQQALKSGSMLAGGYTALVGSGFGLYLAATTIVHAIATTLLGVVLPFSFYTSLTSGIALLLNPFVAVAIAGGGGWWFKNRQERRVRRRLAALTVLEITIAGGRGGAETPP